MCCNLTRPNSRQGTDLPIGALPLVALTPRHGADSFRRCARTAFEPAALPTLAQVVPASHSRQHSSCAQGGDVSKCPCETTRWSTVDARSLVDTRRSLIDARRSTLDVRPSLPCLQQCQLSQAERRGRCRRSRCSPTHARVFTLPCEPCVSTRVFVCASLCETPRVLCTRRSVWPDRESRWPCECVVLVREHDGRCVEVSVLAVGPHAPIKWSTFT